MRLLPRPHHDPKARYVFKPWVAYTYGAIVATFGASAVVLVLIIKGVI
jgi:hypothetical protein